MIIRPKSETTLSVVWGVLVRLAVAVAAAYLLWRLRSVLIAVILSVILAYAILPQVDFLCRWRIRGISLKTQRLIATILVFVLLLTATALVIRLFVKPFEDQLVKLKDNLGSTVSSIEMHVDKASAWYSDIYKNLPPDIKDFVDNSRKEHLGKIAPAVEVFAGKVIASTLAWLTHIVDIVLIPVLAFYFVIDYRSLRREFLGVVPKKYVRQVLFIFRDTGQIMQSYVIGQFILCLLAAVLTGAVLYALHMDYALVLAVFAGITRAIPVIGPVLSGIPITILGGLKSTNTALFLLGFTVFLHFAESKFIMPRLIGKRMHLHPAVVLIVLLIGSEFFGVLGMFLAAPVAAVIRELVRFYLLRNREIRIKSFKNGVDDLPTTYVRSE